MSEILRDSEYTWGSALAAGGRFGSRCEFRALRASTLTRRPRHFHAGNSAPAPRCMDDTARPRDVAALGESASRRGMQVFRHLSLGLSRWDYSQPARLSLCTPLFISARLSLCPPLFISTSPHTSRWRNETSPCRRRRLVNKPFCKPRARPCRSGKCPTNVAAAPVAACALTTGAVGRPSLTLGLGSGSIDMAQTGCRLCRLSLHLQGDGRGSACYGMPRRGYSQPILGDEDRHRKVQWSSWGEVAVNGKARQVSNNGKGKRAVRWLWADGELFSPFGNPPDRKGDALDQRPKVQSAPVKPQGGSQALAEVCVYLPNRRLSTASASPPTYTLFDGYLQCTLRYCTPRAIVSFTNFVSTNSPGALPPSTRSTIAASTLYCGVYPMPAAAAPLCPICQTPAPPEQWFIPGTNQKRIQASRAEERAAMPREM
ncbi:hypothetical protein PMIN01_04109 [Paraphaeosphaeria minitans]|uniref:Uncharacterized protein n=1 Tax=Paraphaeosphaeria minitans TaxID=565426 RepID=A0A9P6GP49_9PLEO|nr:hypothetical protein PMIN01_04109 [Paraphaeosphaeria minitans]